MKGIAAFIIIVSFSILFALWVFLISHLLLGLVYDATDNEWQFEKSPKTSICYEIHYRDAFIVITESMNPVDDSYCEDD